MHFENSLIYWVLMPLSGGHAVTISEEGRAIGCCVHTSSSAISSFPERTTLMAAALSEFLTCTP